MADQINTEFRRQLNEDIAERLLGLTRDSVLYGGRPVYGMRRTEKPDRSELEMRNDIYIWIREGDGPAVPVDFTNWSNAGYAIGRLLPALHPAQFLAELLAMFNWTQQQDRTIAILPLEPNGNLFAMTQADGVRTRFGLFCEAFPQVPPFLWKHIFEHLAALTLSETDTNPFFDDINGGLQYLDDDALWMDILASAQNNDVPEVSSHEQS